MLGRSLAALVFAAVFNACSCTNESVIGNTGGGSAQAGGSGGTAGGSGNHAGGSGTTAGGTGGTAGGNVATAGGTGGTAGGNVATAGGTGGTAGGNVATAGGTGGTAGGMVATAGGTGGTAGGMVATAGGTGGTAGGMVATAGGTGSTAGGTGTAMPFADLRVDSNRDGVVDATGTTDDSVETVWNVTSGAIMLANIDDDSQRCSTSTSQNDTVIAQCNDAQDTIVNGPNDALDMAPMRILPWANGPTGTLATLTVSPASAAGKVRFFYEAAGGTLTFFDHNMYGFGPTALAAGVNLKVEATDIVRNSATWDGYVDITLTVTAPYPGGPSASDTVRMRVAPVMTFSHMTNVVQAYATLVPQDQDSLDFRTDVQTALTAAGIAAPLNSMTTPGQPDQWTQDFFETGYMNMPTASGGTQLMRIALRSANLYNPQSTTNPLRTAGKIVFTQLRGPDVGGIQQFQAGGSSEASLDSFGNFETIPPFTFNGQSYPLGRILRGSITSFHPDQSFLTMMESQAVQPPVYIDTSWLLVGHVDETISFLPANTPRGWIMLVNDAALARTMLQQQVTAGNGSAIVFPGQQTYNAAGTAFVSAERTINQILADTSVMNESAAAATEVNAQIQIIKAATGLTDPEIIHIPYLHEPVSGYSVAYNPGTVNLFLINGSNVASAQPHGPIINGQDIFKQQMQTALSTYGYIVRWTEEWYLYHINLGEVHCGSNATRVIPAAKWWESGR